MEKCAVPLNICGQEKEQRQRKVSPSARDSCEYLHHELSSRQSKTKRFWLAKTVVCLGSPPPPLPISESDFNMIRHCEPETPPAPPPLPTHSEEGYARATADFLEHALLEVVPVGPENVSRATGSKPA
ncbi:unnamed protein product [Arctogadus glacialis]